MKKQFMSLGFALVAINSANAAITFSGNAGVSLRDRDGVAVNAKHAMLVVDTTSSSNIASNGFLGGGWYTAGSTAGVAATSAPTIAEISAGITAGSYFGGDRVLAVSTTSASGSISFSGGINIDDYQGKNFAVVYFAQTAAELTTSVAGAYFGIFAGADWVFPGTPNQTASFSPSAFTGSTAYAQLSAAPTALQINTAGTGALGFFTGSGIAGDTVTPGSKLAVFQVEGIPEPSAALLGAMGALGLLRRRRN